MLLKISSHTKYRHKRVFLAVSNSSVWHWVGPARRSHQAAVQRDRKSREVTWRQLVPWQLRGAVQRARWCVGESPSLQRGTKVDPRNSAYLIKWSSWRREIHLSNRRQTTVCFRPCTR